MMETFPKATPKSGELRVLVIDDDPTDFTVIKKMLRKRTHHIALAYDDGEGEVLDRMLSGGFDACLLDCRLPGRSGIEVLREYVASVDMMPVIMLTGYDSEETAAVCLQAGAADYLCKDELSGRMIERSIRYAIEQHRLRRQLSESNRRVAHEERIKSYGILAGRIGHEFNNLAAVIQANVEQLRRMSGGDQDVERRLSSIMEAVGRSVDIASAIVRIAQPAQPGVAGVSDVDDVGGRVRHRFSALAVKLDIELQFLPPERPVRLGLGPDELETCLSELVRNALEAHLYTSGDQALVRFGVERIGESTVHLFVYDNGCGIPDEVFDDVYRPGFTTHPARDPAREAVDLGPAAGFGLSTVEHTVLRAGGTMAITSEPSAGTTVSLVLPRTA